MVKDNKFAAEPSADATADSKKQRGPKVTNVTTTDNVMEDKGDAKTDKHLKQAEGSDEDKMYQAYVKGDSIQSIADEFGVEAAEVLAAVEKKERARK